MSGQNEWQGAWLGSCGLECMWGGISVLGKGPGGSEGGREEAWQGRECGGCRPTCDVGAGVSRMLALGSRGPGLTLLHGFILPLLCLLPKVWPHPRFLPAFSQAKDYLGTCGLPTR